jgi:hypothetical protein
MGGGAGEKLDGTDSAYDIAETLRAVVLLHWLVEDLLGRARRECECAPRIRDRRLQGNALRSGVRPCRMRWFAMVLS